MGLETITTIFWKTESIWTQSNISSKMGKLDLKSIVEKPRNSLICIIQALQNL